MRWLAKLTPYVVIGLLSWASWPAAEGSSAPPPAESPERPPDQTYLTFPEWFLVFSPEEIATYMVDGRPSEFPYLGHVRQFWQSYGAVSERVAGRYPFNPGYHVMIMVIGVSTTGEYAIHAAYETAFGRLGEFFSRGAPGRGGFELSPEDAYAARVAREYVDFINITPWYEFDFRRALTGLWVDVPWVGPGMLRKWERRYALTSEYLMKALYADFIKWGTGASYLPPVALTRVRVSHWPPGFEPGPAIGQVEDLGPLGVQAMLPRYQAFTRESLRLARGGADFLEVAGNTRESGDAIVISVLAQDTSFATPEGAELLFEQPLLTAPPSRRVVLSCSIGALGDTLRAIDARGERVEHVFDF